MTWRRGSKAISLLMAEMGNAGMTTANNLRRTLAMRHKNICAGGGGVRLNAPRTWHVLSPVSWLVALVLLGVLAAACSENQAGPASPAATSTPEGGALATHLYALEREVRQTRKFRRERGSH